MRPLFPLCLALACTALPGLAADTPLSATEFEAYALGKTLSFAVDGAVYGAEQYLPGRKVIWAFEGDICKSGHWFESGAEICFVYEDNPDSQCWLFYQGSGGLTARFTGDPEGTALKEVAQSPTPLSCPGPDVGV